MKRNGERLLVDRDQAKTLLSCSTSKLIRLENKGILRPIKLGGPISKTYYNVKQLEELAGVKKSVPRVRI